jgi:hypothetical protein
MSSMSPITTLLSAAHAAPAASEAQSAPASIKVRLSDFIPIPPDFTVRQAARRQSPSPSGHNAWRRGAWQPAL